MKKIALLADLHGNMTATLAAERELDRIAPDEVWFLGDAVGKGPRSAEACDWVRRHCQHHIGGNWDYGIGKSGMNNEFHQQQLGAERMAWLNSLPLEQELMVSGVCFRLFHGRPLTGFFNIYVDDETLNSFMTANGKNYGGIVCADSHQPFVRLTERGYAINTGSIGNNLGVTRAHFLLLEGYLGCTEAAPLHISTVAVPYDNEAEVRLAESCPELPAKEAYINEIRTGVYSRK